MSYWVVLLFGGVAQVEVWLGVWYVFKVRSLKETGTRYFLRGCFWLLLHFKLIINSANLVFILPLVPFSASLWPFYDF